MCGRSYASPRDAQVRARIPHPLPPSPRPPPVPAAQTERLIRFVGLSTALANARDLADWLAIPKEASVCGARGGGWGGTPGSWVPSRSQGSRQHRSAGPRAPRPLPKTACHATPTPRACSTSSPRCARCPWSATSRCVSAHVHAARMLTSDAFHHACPRPPCPLPPPPPTPSRSLTPPPHPLPPAQTHAHRATPASFTAPAWPP